MYGYIYITTNLVNGKKYIGQSSYHRVRNDNYLGSGKHLKQALEKYGKDNFSKEILAEASSLEELNKLEQEFISKYDAVNSRDFYNISPGGRASLGFTGKTHSNERNRKLSERYKGHKVSNKVRQTMSKIGKITVQVMNSTFVECPHCGKSGTKGPMNRWHMNNCKLQK